MFNTSNNSNGTVSSSSSNINSAAAAMHHSSSASHLNASSNTTNRPPHDEISDSMYMAPASSSTPIQFSHQSTAPFYHNAPPIDMYPRTNNSSNYYAPPVKPFSYYPSANANADQMSYNHESQMQGAFNSNENFYNYKAPYRAEMDEDDEVDDDDENEDEVHMGDEAADEPEEHHLMAPNDNGNNHYAQYAQHGQNEMFNEYDMSRFNSMQAQKIVSNNGSEFYQGSLLMPNYNYSAYGANGSAPAATTENGNHLPSQSQLDEANAFSLYNLQSSATQMQIEAQHHANSSNLIDPNAQFNAINTSASNVPHFDYSALNLSEPKSDILNSSKKLPDWSLNTHRSKSKTFLKNIYFN